MKINLNQQCQVVLTKTGAKVFNDYHIQFGLFYCKQKGDIIKGQFWDIMRIFGPILHNGMIEVPFENCELDVEDF